MKIKALFWSLFAASLTLLVCLHYSRSLRQSAPEGSLPEAIEHASSRTQASSKAEGVGETEASAEDDAVAREQWVMSRHGFNLGVPPHAYADAMAQRRRMEAASMAVRSRAATSSPSWTFIGPMPMKGQFANFGGQATPPNDTGYGPAFDAAGRVSAVAIDPSGNIYVGAASGGVWLSTNHGNSFSWISGGPNGLPTQAIGSIAIDSTNTSPPTVYVGTGEGNGSDSLYGLGLWATQNFGATWTPVDASEFSGNGAYQAFTSLDVPCDALFAGTGNGISFSRGVSEINECEPGVFSTGFDCEQGAIYESIPPSPGTNWNRIFGMGNPQDPNGGPVRSLAIGAIIDTQSFAEIPAMFATIDGLGLISTEDSTGLPFTCGSGTLSPFDVAGLGNSVLVQPFPGAVGRSSVATGNPVAMAFGNPAPDQQIYAMIGDVDNRHYYGFFSSGAGGESWTQETTPCAGTTDTGATWSTNPTDCTAAGASSAAGATSIDGTRATGVSSQSSYDQVLAVWPGDPTASTVYFGGIGIYRSTDGGASWDFIAQNGGTHCDQHAIAFDPTDNTHMYVGNDGGLFRFDTSTDEWTALNDTINSGQIYGIGPHPTDNNQVLAGFQDNGVQLYSGALGWDFSWTADGGFTAFDYSDPTVAYMDADTSGGVPQLKSSNTGGVI